MESILIIIIIMNDDFLTSAWLNGAIVYLCWQARIILHVDLILSSMYLYFIQLHYYSDTIL